MARGWIALLLTVALGGCAATQQPTARFRTATEPVRTTHLQCWPLPAATLPHFPVIAQSAGPADEAGERRLTMTFQFFRVDAEDAGRHLTDAMTAGGFRRVGGTEDGLVFRRRGFGDVTVTVTPFDAGSRDVPLEGTIVLDLPGAATPAASRGTCPTPRRPLGT